ncbi:efflux RND transporter permease subunit [Oscillatoria sp. FACHB-1406]|uniref:efflux RND transporter permease subunit n=1 Tax=Oscillatoria sp. FACHB-1406 TaxID=2692846 RepID=UPI001681FCC4|nr:efflux RND transporter permease subunit [Oscillatoria sp. FACHB-1406]MBD2578082.1 efflux RND transporter permease subunit [Oscillatoria sp. FACHB-1406]
MVTWRERLNISRWAIAHPWLTTSFWIAVAVAGALAFSSLKYALFPDITFPVIIVRAEAPLTATLDTERQLTLPLEAALKTLPGVDSLRSSTYSGRSILNLAFAVGSDLEGSKTVVETRLKQAQLPPDSTFEVMPLNLNESTAVSYALQWRGNGAAETEKIIEDLTKVAREKILPAIAKLPGVRRVDLLGNDTRQEIANAEKIDIPQSLVRLNGENVLAFRVIKEAKANTLEVVRQVETTVQALQKTLPDVRLTLAETQAEFIREATQATIEALLGAIILAVLVIYPFLRSWRATLISALAIPLSLLGTFIVMAIAGFNLETITLLALALVIGIIVDDAIVDVENISRHIEAGDAPKQAALKGTDEIGLAVSAATLTIAAVFLPVAFMGGTIGQFFKPFGLTVSAAVLISLLVARTLSPVLCFWWLRSSLGRASKSPNNPDEPKSSLLERLYRPLLQWSLLHRNIVIGLAILSFAAGVALIPLIPKGFIPKLDRGEFNIVFTSPLPSVPAGNPQPAPAASPARTESDSGSSLEAGAFDWISELKKSPEKALLSEARGIAEQIETVVLPAPEIESSFAVMGVRGQPNQGKMYLKLKRDRQLSTAEIQEQLRQQLAELQAKFPNLKAVKINVEDIQFVDTIDQKPLQIALIGDDLASLDKAAAELKTRVKTLPGFVEVEVSSEGSDAKNPALIERLDGQRAVYFSANLQQGNALGDATEEVMAIARSLVPPGVTLDLKGDAASSSTVLNSFGATLALSTVCMLAVLLLLFRRLLEPLVVGLSLPLSLVGAMLALLLTQSDFGMISLIGFIFLLGLLDKNAVLLTDYASQLQRTGLSRDRAILEASQARLRPILMTTLSTILGMLPLALGLGAGAELRQPMAVAIIGGLVTSTLLSLVVVPVLYSLLEDIWGKLRLKK